MKRGAIVLALAAIVLSTTLAAGATPDRASDGPDADRPFSRCGELTVRSVRARGGCRFRAKTARMEIAVVSIFGDQPLGRCVVRFSARIGEDMRIAISKVSIDRRGPRSSSCGDFMACAPNPATTRETGPVLPWLGRLTPADGGRHRVQLDMFFDTCFGRFEGRAPFELDRVDARSWRLRTSNAAVGASGLELSGIWTLQSRD